MRRESCVLRLVLAALVASGLALNTLAQLPIQEPSPAPTEPITIAAESIRNWTQNEERILLLHGNVYIAQGLKRLRAPHAVVWINEGTVQKDGTKRVTVYVEGGVRVDGRHGPSQSPDGLESFQTRTDLRIEMKERLSGPSVDDPVYRHAEARRGGSSGSISSVQLTAFQVEPPLTASDGTPLRRLRTSPRTLRPFELDTVRVSDTENAIVITGGINLIVYNVQKIGTVDISTDRMVMWTRTTDARELAKGQTEQPASEPLEMYLEGNVVVRQGTRTIQCKKMYYDVNHNLAVANDAAIESVNEELNAPIFFRAKKLRQVAEDKFIAEATQLTPSVFPNPTYESQSEQIVLDGIPGSETRQPSGEQGEPRSTVSATNNFFYIEGIPVFYLPYVEKDLDDLSTPLRKFAIAHSGVYGTELLTTWDMYALLGWRRPPEVTKWEMDLDYMGARGPAAGTNFEYRSDSMFGLEGKNWGQIQTFWIDDNGKDRLGRDRQNIEPEQEQRGRLLWRHRQDLPDDFTMAIEFAWISDINFLEQFFEKEWEEDKDQETVFYLKQQRDNWAWSVLARARILDWVTTTNTMPKLDFYWLGESILDDWLTYYTHSSLAYLELLDMDRSIGDIYPKPFGNEGPTYVGSRVDTMHEVDLPFSVGPIRVAPYAIGRATAWSNTLSDDNSRLYGAAGARASMPLWRIYPCVESDLWNLNGLAHKIVFSLDYSIAQANLDHTLLPLYDELEEDSEQVFRRRFLFRDYTNPGIPFPPGLDPRTYAIRTGLMTSAEAVDDLQALRMDIRQRLQTKRGLPGERHVIDWMTLDTSVTWFPNQERDNFGEDFGLYTYDYSWHVGDRTSILSHGWFETYHQGPKLWNVGLFLERPPRGSFYVGYTSMEPVGSRVAQLTYNYWMSPKWVSSLTTSHDFGETKNLGQSLVLTRIGADIVFRLGFTYNPLRNNFAFGIELEPRLDPSLHVGTLGGHVPLESAPVE